MLLVISLLAPIALFGDEAGAGTIEDRIRVALSSVPHAQTEIGVCVLDLSTGKLVFESSPDKPLIPASSMKVFTMAVALVELGPKFTFKTVLATDGKDLLLIGDGDPAFGDRKLYRAYGQGITSDFKRWANVLLEEEVTVIAGGLVIDESIFDGQRLHPQWEREDLGKWYAAPVGALNFNDNCLDITVTPASQPGRLTTFSVVPESAAARVTNRCMTGGKGRPVLHNKIDTFEYIISGHCNKRWPFGAVAFPDPSRLCADALVRTFEKQGVTILGDVRRGRVRLPSGELPEDIYVIGTHETPIGDVLHRTGKDSQNLFAECLFKRAGYAYSRRSGVNGAIGSWQLGSAAVVELLFRGKINLTGFAATDGSGLSRENRCTARQLAGVLRWMHHRPEGRLMRESMSIAGVDGSLRKRLKDVPRRVFGKTGTMRGVRALGGYVVASGKSDVVDGKSDRPGGYAFAIIFNGYTGPSTPYKEIQDRICRALIDELDRVEAE